MASSTAGSKTSSAVDGEAGRERTRPAQPARGLALASEEQRANTESGTSAPKPLAQRRPARLCLPRGNPRDEHAHDSAAAAWLRCRAPSGWAQARPCCRSSLPGSLPGLPSRSGQECHQARQGLRKLRDQISEEGRRSVGLGASRSEQPAQPAWRQPSPPSRRPRSPPVVAIGASRWRTGRRFAGYADWKDCRSMRSLGNPSGGARRRRAASGAR